MALGDKYKDKVSGFVGVSVAEHHYLNGCTRISLQPEVDKDGKLPETATFDEPQLEIIKAGFVTRGGTSTGGPSKYEDVRRY